MTTQARRLREKEQRRNAILDAAETLFFGKGFAATTMDDVATRTELSKGTLYLYFKNKEELQLGLNVRAKRQLYDMMCHVPEGLPGLEKVVALGQVYLRFALEHPNYHATMLSCMNQEGEGLTQHNPFAEEAHLYGEKALYILIDTIVAGQQDGSIDPQLQPFPTAMLLWAQLSGLTEIMAAKRQYFADQGLKEGDLYAYAFVLTRKTLGS